MFVVEVNKKLMMFHLGPEVGNVPDGDNEEVGPEFRLLVCKERL